MPLTSSVVYKGELRTLCTHLESGKQIITDAPVDNQGNGDAFSPTDLLATSLAACMITVMGIKARDMNIDLRSTQAEVEKVMLSDPRRVGAIRIKLMFPDLELDEKQQEILRRAAMTCPVIHSLHPDIEKTVTFEF